MLLNFLCIFLWILLYHTISHFKITDRKINKNIVCFTHSTLCTAFAYYNTLQDSPNYNLLYFFSFSYFVWDIIYILYNKDCKDLIFIYHHIICLIALNSLIKNNNSEIINKIFFLGEASNFFNYITYHCIKFNYFKNNLIILKIVQFIWFFYFRMIMISLYIYHDFHKLDNKKFGYLLLTVHILSFLWIYNQFKYIVKYLMR